MKILNMRILRGPNFWSITRKLLIQLKIDLEKFENLPTNLIDGFADKLIELLPSLQKHFCSSDHEGGFISRMEEGTWLGHVIEHVALELQYLAGMNCGFGRTRSGNKPGIYNIIFSYIFENAGVYAANAAFNLVNTIANGKSYENLNHDLRILSQINENEKFGISTQAIVDEAIKRDIPYTRLANCSLITFGQGMNQKRIWATTTSTTSYIGAEIASDKQLTKKLLMKALVPIPKGEVISDSQNLERVINEIGFPLVIKPINGNHGRGVTSNICHFSQVIPAFDRAKKISKKIIIEKCIKGYDFRVLVVNYKVIAVAQRFPAFIIGDGVSTIQDLIDTLNQDINRGEGHSNFLTKIRIDEVTLTILKENNLILDSILSVGQILYLKYTANLSMGGSAIDVTDKVHMENINLFERIAVLLNLNLCGVDVITENIGIPLTKNNGAIIEVNAGPGLRMHISSFQNSSRNVTTPILDMLYPPNTQRRIPIVAVTGTNGKTTTVRMLSYLAAQSGYKVGFTCTDGIYLNNTLIYEGDCSGPESARTVLQDPTINFAVLECARGGILRAGLGFDKCDVSIILNISEDHLGLEGIETTKDLTKLKSVVALSTKPCGYAILNADDDLVYQISKEIECQFALFSLFATNARIKNHCGKGGIGIYLENNYIILQQHQTCTVLSNIKDLPITFGGKSTSMYPNVLATLLAATVLNLPLGNAFHTLKNFFPNILNTPGRMNIFSFSDFTVLLDYGHNLAAFKEMAVFLNQINATKKIGIIAIPGDRREEDFINIGMIAAQMFDEIIVRYEKNPRGRTNELITSWLIKGIISAGLNTKYSVMTNELEALSHAIKNAGKGNYIVHFSTDIPLTINYLEKCQSEFNNISQNQSFITA